MLTEASWSDHLPSKLEKDGTLNNVCPHRKTNVAFATVITRLQESPQCQRLPFMSFLLLPFQRITRIKMLIEVSGIMGTVFFGSLWSGLQSVFYHNEKHETLWLLDFFALNPDHHLFVLCNMAYCCFVHQNILKRTKEGTTEEQTASKALDSVSKVTHLSCFHPAVCLPTDIPIVPF